LSIPDPLAEGWYDHDMLPPPGIAFLRERGVLKPGARVFDFGAHHGVVALVLARDVGPTGYVVAVEADSHNARTAEVNRELNSAENLKILHAGGAAQEGTMGFSEGLNGSADERGLARVPARTIDGLAEEYGVPDLVLIDVEGYEEQVLRGGRAVLDNGRTTFLVELHEPKVLAAYDATPASVCGFLESFEVFVSPDKRTPFVPLTTPPTARMFLCAFPRS
jgi:FkbM family methyltransferase